jgi:hypothetical protein
MSLMYLLTGVISTPDTQKYTKNQTIVRVTLHGTVYSEIYVHVELIENIKTRERIYQRHNTIKVYVPSPQP